MTRGPHTSDPVSTACTSVEASPRPAAPAFGLLELKPGRPAERGHGGLDHGQALLIVSRDGALVRRVRRAAGPVTLCLVARDVDEARRLALGCAGPDGPRLALALIDHDACAAGSPELAELLTAQGAAVVLAVGGLDADTAARALAAGCRDLVARNLRVPELAQRLAAAAESSGAGAIRSRRMESAGGPDDLRSLERLYRRTRHAPEQAAREKLAVRSDLVPGETTPGANMNQVTTATEFKGLIKNELDIEQLLRTTLEFVLARSGPTNAAVFLPTTSGDYSLGAYVNYDCPKETVDILLDHVANTIAPRFENAKAVLQLVDDRSLDSFLGEDAAWLGDSSVIGFACRHDGEVLAIVMLFRDRLSAFGPLLVEQLRTIGELFASQLARVIHIHHRHLPREKWGSLGDPPACDDEDLAA